MTDHRIFILILLLAVALEALDLWAWAKVVGG